MPTSKRKASLRRATRRSSAWSEGSDAPKEEYRSRATRSNGSRQRGKPWTVGRARWRGDAAVTRCVSRRNKALAAWCAAVEFGVKPTPPHGTQDPPHGQRAPPQLGQRNGPPLQARPSRLLRRVGGGESSAHRAGRRARDPRAPQPDEAPRLLPPPLQPERRGARRAAHLHLHAEEGRRGPDQQLDGARRRLREAEAALRRLHEGPHDVRRAVHHGPARLAAREGRHRAHRQRLRRPQHAHHDAHGEDRAQAARPGR